MNMDGAPSHSIAHASHPYKPIKDVIEETPNAQIFSFHMRIIAGDGSCCWPDNRRSQDRWDNGNTRNNYRNTCDDVAEADYHARGNFSGANGSQLNYLSGPDWYCCNNFSRPSRYFGNNSLCTFR